MQVRRLVPFILVVSSWCFAGAIVDPSLSGITVANLGSPVSLTGAYYYTALDFVDQFTLLLAVGNPASTTQTEAIYSIPVNRNGSGAITSLGAAVVDFSATVSTGAVYSNIISGGLANAPGGAILYDTKSLGYLGQYSGGVSQLSPVSGALGGLGYVPAGGSSQLLLSTTTGNWYDLTYSGGAFSVGPALSLGIPADSFAYFPAGFSPSLSVAGILVGDATAQAIRLYGINPATGQPTGAGLSVVSAPLSGPEGLGYGLVRDPVTGDFLFTGSNNEIYLLEGASAGSTGSATPEPGTFALFAAAAGVLWAVRKSRGKGRGSR